jgi:hypothetical protein
MRIVTWSAHRIIATATDDSFAAGRPASAV